MEVVDAMAMAGMLGGLALTLSDQQYGQTVGLDTSTLSAAAKEEVGRFTRLEGKATLDDFIAFAASGSAAASVVPIVQSFRAAPLLEGTIDELLRGRRGARRHRRIRMYDEEAILPGPEALGARRVARLDRIGV